MSDGNAGAAAAGNCVFFPSSFHNIYLLIKDSQRVSTSLCLCLLRIAAAFQVQGVSSGPRWRRRRRRRAMIFHLRRPRRSPDDGQPPPAAGSAAVYYCHEETEAALDRPIKPRQQLACCPTAPPPPPPLSQPPPASTSPPLSPGVFCINLEIAQPDIGNRECW